MGQPLGRQRQHHLIHPAQPPAPLGHHHRLERAGPVPGHLDLDRADLGEHRLGPGPVPRVPRVMPSRIVGCVADMVGHLALQHRLQHLLGQIGQQPARAHQAHPVRLGPHHQLVGQVLGRDLPGQTPDPEPAPSPSSSHQSCRSTVCPFHRAHPATVGDSYTVVVTLPSGPVREVVGPVAAGVFGPPGGGVDADAEKVGDDDGGHRDREVGEGGRALVADTDPVGRGASSPVV